MQIIVANNINSAFRQGLQYLLDEGDGSNSRNGKVLRAPEPVVTEYMHPRARVLWNDVRRPNPYFHLMESMWMLAGRNDIAFVSLFNKRMTEYSDNGVTQAGAYGHRWRKHFHVDQVGYVIQQLATPGNRRAVLAMYDPVVDCEAGSSNGRDIPCNTTIYFVVRPNGLLDMTVCCRSNDIIWGCYGANAVHMSILHEYVSGHTGYAMGSYYQVSNDYHAYTDIYSEATMLRMVQQGCVTYPNDVTPLLQGYEQAVDFDYDLAAFFKSKTLPKFRTQWFSGTISPMLASWLAYKNSDHAAAMEYAEQIQGADWRDACVRWLQTTKGAKA